ncbi:unnamed protein product [Penicillium nalgiovense]|uniref:Uncharacterized protein n=1 Tax=Penicillium nalgiovense TaxID=60175 RepID=A0A9W4MS82_PENNA|nr:unnamed protein product [Penicillium nalgiovense]CAG7941892.1 unnamed protein product [Penicillium nalgiovense]CAG7953675.1 unnamed protein product [Penicillium nalgiovense]CAG7962427.1 unnamed protein product [Penicillium nalgiovense]CAG8086567.1 unnamed protein product [Penicillium nalgiovense]
MAFAGTFRGFFSIVALILILLCAFAGSHRHLLLRQILRKYIHLPDPTGGNTPQHLSIHVMSICQGIKKNITDCTFLRVPVHLLQTSALANSQGVVLLVGHEIAWPEYTISRLAALTQTSQLLSIFYVIAIGASGLSSGYWITSFRRGNLGWHLHGIPVPGRHCSLYGADFALALASNAGLPPSLWNF